MVDFNTIRFISILNEIAEKTKYGICPLIVYDKIENSNALFYQGTPTAENNGECPAIAEVFENDSDENILYNDVSESCGTNIVVVCTNNPYVRVTFKNESFSVIIENGRWYTADCTL